jgi:hemerythrin-like domain-containing protein
MFMKLSEIRRELVEQHAEIRRMMDLTQAIAEGMRDRPECRGDLHERVGHLAHALRAHDLREEALLRHVIPTIDAWAATHEADPRDESNREHAGLDAALRGVPDPSQGVAAVGVVALMRLMRDHMDREEAAAPAEARLRDELVVDKPVIRVP